MYKEDVVITKVLGDPSHAIWRGKLCCKCAIAYNGAWRDATLRLTRPLRRVGAKGRGSFTEISWHEALAEIAKRFGSIIDARDARTIIQTHYTGTVGLIGGSFPLRLFNRMGATEVDPDTVCNKAGHVALELAFGDSLESFDPRTAKDARTILIWGANPSHSAPHQDVVFVRNVAEAGAKIIVVDPLGHDTATSADIHLKRLPGTDAALAFAFLKVMRDKGLVDQAFVEQHVLGAKEFDAAIDSVSLPEAAELCGVPADLIETAATAYATGPSLLWLGQGVQRQRQGGNVIRALAALVAFSGNIGKPGAGFLYMNGTGSRGVDMATVTMPELTREGTSSISHMDLAATLEDPHRAKALVDWNNNPATSSPEQRRLRQALECEDLFHVAVDLFHTDTSAYADIVLPAASFLEFNDLLLSYFDLTLSAQVKTCDPPGEALSNHAIFRRLARAMGYNDPGLFESEADLIERLLAQTPYQGSCADLAEIGTTTLFAEPRLQFADLDFATPSGRIKLASDKAVALGLPRVPTPHADARPEPGLLHIISPASPWLMNSSHGNDPVIRRKLGPPTVALHPDDAAAGGFSEGDAVVLVNETGHCRLPSPFLVRHNRVSASSIKADGQVRRPATRTSTCSSPAARATSLRAPRCTVQSSGWKERKLQPRRARGLSHLRIRSPAPNGFWSSTGVSALGRISRAP